MNLLQRIYYVKQVIWILMYSGLHCLSFGLQNENNDSNNNSKKKNYQMKVVIIRNFLWGYSRMGANPVNKISVNYSLHYTYTKYCCVKIL